MTLAQDSTGINLKDSPAAASTETVRDSITVIPKKKVFSSVKTDTVSHPVAAHTTIKASSSDRDASTEISEKTIATNSFYGGHELKVVHNGPQSLNRNTPDWIFPLLILLFASFAWLRVYYEKYFRQIATAFFNNNLTNQIVRDENILVQRASIVLNIVFNLVAALFLYFVSIHYSWSIGGIGNGFNRYVFFALVISMAYAMKFLILKICGYLFNLDHEMAAYIFNIFLINNVLGIFLIPVTALLAYSVTLNTTWIIYGSLILVGAALLYRIIRGLSVGFSSPVFSLYYLFLYLCTLEFAPWLVLIKILKLK